MVFKGFALFHSVSGRFGNESAEPVAVLRGESQAGGVAGDKKGERL